MGQRERHVEHAEGDDERRQRDLLHQCPVEQAEAAADDQAQRDGGERWQGALSRHLGDHDAAERHHGTARQVDARGEDDQRLADGEGADDHDLLHDQREVAAREELIGREGEEDAGKEEGDQWPGGRLREQSAGRGRCGEPGVRLGCGWWHGRWRGRGSHQELLAWKHSRTRSVRYALRCVMPAGDKQVGGPTAGLAGSQVCGACVRPWAAHRPFAGNPRRQRAVKQKARPAREGIPVVHGGEEVKRSPCRRRRRGTRRRPPLVGEKGQAAPLRGFKRRRWLARGRLSPSSSPGRRRCPWT